MCYLKLTVNQLIKVCVCVCSEWLVAVCLKWSQDCVWCILWFAVLCVCFLTNFKNVLMCLLCHWYMNLFSAGTDLSGHAQRVQGDEREHLQRHCHQRGERHQATTNPQHAHSKERDTKAHLRLGQSLQWPPDGGWKLHPAPLRCCVVGLSEKCPCSPWAWGA